MKFRDKIPVLPFKRSLGSLLMSRGQNQSSIIGLRVLRKALKNYSILFIWSSDSFISGSLLIPQEADIQVTGAVGSSA